MGLGTQILMGSATLAFCAIVHITFVTGSLPRFRKLPTDHPKHRIALLLGLGSLIIVASHTVQIWTWAALIYLSDYFPDFETSFYFSTVTYTALGYGDIVPPTGFRVVATFAAITGLLTFGISTAFMIAIISRLIPGSFGDR